MAIKIKVRVKINDVEFSHKLRDWIDTNEISNPWCSKVSCLHYGSGVCDDTNTNELILIIYGNLNNPMWRRNFCLKRIPRKYGEFKEFLALGRMMERYMGNPVRKYPVEPVLANGDKYLKTFFSLI